jgi:hydrogenase expression/formation protein HypE
VPIKSDCASLNRMLAEVLHHSSGVSIMRDPTRGGLATTLVEIAEDFHLTMKINEVDLPVKEEVHGVCDLLGFDPLYLANEGKAIIVVAANEKDKVLDILSEFPEGRESVVIGSIMGKQKGHLLLETPLGSKRLLN